MLRTCVPSDATVVKNTGCASCATRTCALTRLGANRSTSLALSVIGSAVSYSLNPLCTVITHRQTASLTHSALFHSVALLLFTNHCTWPLLASSLHFCLQHSLHGLLCSSLIQLLGSLTFFFVSFALIASSKKLTQFTLRHTVIPEMRISTIHPLWLIFTQTQPN